MNKLERLVEAAAGAEPAAWERHIVAKIAEWKEKATPSSVDSLFVHWLVSDDETTGMSPHDAHEPDSDGIRFALEAFRAGMELACYIADMSDKGEKTPKEAAPALIDTPDGNQQVITLELRDAGKTIKSAIPAQPGQRPPAGAFPPLKPEPQYQPSDPRSPYHLLWLKDQENIEVVEDLDPKII